MIELVTECSTASAVSHLPPLPPTTPAPPALTTPALHLPARPFPPPTSTTLPLMLPVFLWSTLVVEWCAPTDEMPPTIAPSAASTSADLRNCSIDKRQ